MPHGNFGGPGRGCPIRQRGSDWVTCSIQYAHGITGARDSHALPQATSPDEQEFTRLSAGGTHVVIDRLQGLPGHYEPDRLARLLSAEPPPGRARSHWGQHPAL